MEKLLQAWDARTIQEAVNIYLHLSQNGKTFEDVLNYQHVKRLKAKLKAKAQQQKESISSDPELKHCPKCGLWMKIVDARWICSPGCGSCNGIGCGYTEPIDKPTEPRIM